MGNKTGRMVAAMGVIAFIITGCGKGEADRGQENEEILVGMEVKNGADAGDSGRGMNGSAGYDTGGYSSGDMNIGAGEKSSVGTDGSIGTENEAGQARSGGSAWDEYPDSWKAAYFSLDNAYTQVLSAGGTFYALSDRDGQARLDCIGKETLAVEGTVSLEDAAMQSGMAADEEGNLYLPTEGEETGIWKIDTGSQKYEKIELEDCSNRNDLFLKGIETGGYTYIWCGMAVLGTEQINGREQEIWHMVDRVYVKDRQMKTVFYQEISNTSGVDVLYFQIDRKGRPGFLVKDEKEIQLREIDLAGRKMKDPVSLGTAFDCFGMEDANIPEHLTFTGRGWLYCRENHLYEFCYDTQEKVQILDLADYGILSRDILFVGKGEDRIEIIGRDAEYGDLELAVLTPGSSDKTTVTLGVAAVSQELEEAVAQFNRDSTGYRVGIVDYYSQSGSYEDAAEKLKLDVATGKAPDIIALSGVDYRVFSGKGVLADLYDFMEGDRGFSKDMLVQSVLKACEEQGHLYGIAPSFQLHSMWGYADVTKGKSGVTFSELLRLLEDSGKDLNAVGGFSADEPVLTRLCCAAMDEFVDWDEGTCAFDGEYFREVLSFAENYNPGNGDAGYLQGIRERRQVLTVGILSSVADYQMEKEMYDGNLGVIGYPTMKGSGTAVDFRGSAVAVNARGGNQTGAWEFVKYYVLQGYDGQGFPMAQKRFDQVMEAAMQEDYTDSEYGAGQEKLPKKYYGGQDGDIAVYAAAREDVDAVRKLVEGVRNRFEMHPAIQNIINEEAQGYFSGQVDLDRTVDKIQNRVSLLLQEAR